MTDDVIHELRVRRYGIIMIYVTTLWNSTNTFGITWNATKMNIEIELTNIG